MPGGPATSDSDGNATPKTSLAQRLLLALPRLGRDRDRPPLRDRLKEAMLKPAEPGDVSKEVVANKPQSVEDLEHAVARADDKERNLGLIGAPLGAAIGLLITDRLINLDPAAHFANGQINSHHVSVSIYNELLIALLVLSVLMLAFAWFRKRLYLGMVIALYGLTIFNLHYWGFGVPFVLAGAWLLVRAYRLQRDLRVASGDTPTPGTPRRSSAGSNVLRRRSSWRDTPPKPTS